MFFAGVNMDQCVLATLTDAASLGYDCVLVEGASGTTSPEFCAQATIYNVRQRFGFTVTAKEMLAALRAAEKEISSEHRADRPKAARPGEVRDRAG